jgi:hypothetical protein
LSTNTGDSISDSERRRLAAGGEPVKPPDVPGPGAVLGRSGRVGTAAIDPAVLAKLTATPATDGAPETSWSLGAALGLAIGGPFVGVVFAALSSDEASGPAISIVTSAVAGLLFAKANRGISGALVALLGPAAIIALIIYGEVTSGDADPLFADLVWAWFLGSLVPVEVGYVVGRLIAAVLPTRRGAERPGSTEQRGPGAFKPAHQSRVRRSQERLRRAFVPRPEEERPDQIDEIDDILDRIFGRFH